MNVAHPSFLQAADPNISLWKFLSLPKFIYFLSNQALFFCRCDLLGDPYEGTIPVFNAANIRTQFCNPENPKSAMKARKMFRLFTYVNCWHMNNFESMAMWKLYCPDKDGIAIRTKYSKLVASITDNEVYMGCVSYIDHHTESMSLGNNFNLIMHKNRAFEHEKEVRLVKQLPNDIQSVERDFDELKCLKENPSGMTVPIDICETIDCIYVSPYAPKWYYDVVRSVLNNFSINLPLEWSRMSDEPNY